MSVAAGPLLRAVNGGVFVSGATCTVYKSPATTTKVTLYSDAALTTPVTNPQTSDVNGQFNFYVGSGENLRFYIQTAGGTLISDTDPVYPVPVNAKGTTIASASTVDLTTTVGDFVDVSGTTTITSFGSSGANRRVIVRFTGALTLTHNASSLILPGAANITTANGDIAVFTQISAGNWVCNSYSRANGASIITRQGSDLASASTVNIGAATADFFNITGTTTITAFDTVPAGIERTVKFTGALTLTYNATSLTLPGAANITTANGDIAIFRSLGSGNWACVSYARASGKPVTLAINQVATQIFTSSGTYTPTPGMVYSNIEVVGGGASGGGVGGNASNFGAGSGGGAGAYSQSIKTLAQIGASQTVTIGAGGAAPAAGNNVGNDGGTSSVGALVTANGGTHGNPSASFTTTHAAIGGPGGTTGGTGDFKIPGEAGSDSMCINSSGGNDALSGRGGSSYKGVGGKAVNANASASLLTGIAGGGYGSGGSGGAQNSSATGAAGGAGKDGIVIITEFLAV